LTFRRAISTRTEGGEAGAALVLTLVATMVVVAVGMSLLLVADMEVAAAGHHRDDAEVRYAADGGLDFVIQELALMTDWTPVLSGTTVSSLAGPLVLPAVAGGSAIDIAGATSGVQRAAYGGAGWAADTPRWRLFAHGAASTMLPGAALPDRVYLLVWVSDDTADGDGNPDADSNGSVVVRARAMGVRGARCDVQAVIARTAAAAVVRRTSWRVIR
jgi:hypothetical protein